VAGGLRERGGAGERDECEEGDAGHASTIGDPPSRRYS
jgi:hypothetical protein